jgi:hypothetical protein
MDSAAVTSATCGTRRAHQQLLSATSVAPEHHQRSGIGSTFIVDSISATTATQVTAKSPPPDSAKDSSFGGSTCFEAAGQQQPHRQLI